MESDGLSNVRRSISDLLYRSNPRVAAIATAAAVVLAAVLLFNPLGKESTSPIANQGSGSAEYNADSNVQPDVTLPTQPPTISNALILDKHRTQEVATVLRTDNVTWAKDNIGVDELTRVSEGQTLHFSAGELELVFDRSVRMRVRGPALLEIRSPTEVYSRFGVLSARVGDAGKGFVIETPNGRIVDLGTEFGVAVDEKGSTDVAVFRGAVDLTYGSHDNLTEPSITRRLVQGQALTLDLDGSMRRLVSYDDSRFPMFEHEIPFEVEKPSSIFTEVTDNLRDGISAKSYRIVPHGLREDVLAYVDRQHEWNGCDSSGIPSVLQGADYIMPFNEDKNSNELNVNVSIGRPARVFVFMSHIAKVPQWLSDNFTKSDMTIGLDESGEFVTVEGYHLAKGPGKAIDTKFYVWQQDVELPTTLVLGSVSPARRGWGYCMYGIAAVPLEVAHHFDAQASP